MGRENIRLCKRLNIFSLKKKKTKQKKQGDSFCVFSKDVSITEQEIVLEIWKKKEESLIRGINQYQLLNIEFEPSYFSPCHREQFSFHRTPVRALFLQP